MPTPSSAAGNILVVSLSNIGDVILTTPAIVSLAEQFPRAKITVVVGERAATLLEGSRLIHRLVIYRKKGSLWEKWLFLRQLQSEAYDWVVDLRNTLIPYLVKTRRRSPVFRCSKKMAFRERHLDVLGQMGLGAPPLEAFDFFGEAEKSSLLEKLRERGVTREGGWIVAAPVAASELKTWRQEGFREVLGRLAAERSEDILLVGNERERARVEALAALSPKRIYSIAGETTLRELAFVVSRASLLLSNDSAVMHLGYELNRPVVALFGPTHHERYGRTGHHFRVVRAGVPCSPCEKPVCRFGRQHCFEDLEADEVFRACKELLGEPLPSHASAP